MKIKYRKSTLFVLLFFISSSSFSQSPWVNHKQLYAQISANTISNYSLIYQGNRRLSKRLDGMINERSLQSYLEYGLTKKIALLADIPYKNITSQTNGQMTSIRESGSITGFGNLGLGVKYNFTNKKYLVTGQLRVDLSTYVADQPTGLRTGYESLSAIPTISVGRGYNKTYFYAYAGAGIYADDLSNDIRYGGEFGHLFDKRLWAIFTLNARESLKDGERTYDATFQDSYLYVNNQSFISFALKLTYMSSTKLGFTAGTNIISLRANNLPMQRPFSVGVYYKFTKK